MTDDETTMLPGRAATIDDRRGRSRLRACFAAVMVAGGLSAGAALAAAQLPWDLGYKTVLANAQLPKDEFLPVWLGRNPARLIQEKMDGYSGEAIEASVLIEMPDMHAGDPLAIWYVKTANGGRACEYHPKFPAGRCSDVDPARVERFAREAMDFAPIGNATAEREAIARDERGRAVYFSYLGFLSIYVDGKAVQRPITTTEFFDRRRGAEASPDPEAGRLDRAMKRVVAP